MLTPELLKITDDYLERNISLEQLEEWFVPRLPFFFKPPYSSASELATEIEVGLAEISDKTLTEEAFRNSLTDFFNKQTTFVLNYPDVSEENFEGSSNQSFPSPPVPEFATAGFTSVVSYQLSDVYTAS